SVLMLDIDKFKSINDRWGHPAGDRVIQELANVMMFLVRAQDMCGRLGGEEFALILPETDSSGAALIAERLRKTVDESTAVHADDDSVVKFTVSIGIASLTPGDASFDAMLQRADKALYQAKEDGRNRSVIAGNQPYLE
ncbi:GGDEF domain-containing protein, partial [Zoogloea sp.]|uniref:GGDEF domain-containing protein n=1 Tax=Zoogloea sp. TaxID=49181 RepID=UPI0025834DCF